MAILTFNELMNPFAFIDFSTFYSRYSFIIDAVIAFLIFFGIAKVTIGKRFDGRGGQAIITGVGLALSIGFLLMEKTMNFSLRSFGMLAVAIILLLLGFVFYSLLQSLGFTYVNALCLAYIIDYLSVRLVSPSIFDWIAQTAPFINGILGIGFIIALIKLIFSLFARSSLKSMSSSLSRIPSKVNLQNSTENLDGEIDQEKQELDVISSKLIKATKKEIKDGDEMIKIINNMIKLIEKHGTSPSAVTELSDNLNKIRETEHYALLYFNYISKIMDRIGRFDSEYYTRLKAEYETAQTDDQKKLKKMDIEVEEKKREVENTIQRIEKMIIQLTKEFNASVAGAVQFLNNKNPSEAVRYLKASLKTEAKIQELYQEMKGLEKGLKKLTKKNIKYLKQEKKQNTK